MNVADVMTKNVAICRADESLNRAAQLMWEHRCGALPVLDPSGTVLGLVTDRDVCMAAYTQGRRLDDIPIETAMSRPARTCAISSTVDEAEDIMMAHAVRRLAVVDAAGRLEGLVSIDDIARCGAAGDGCCDGDIDLERAALTLGEISRHSTTDDELPRNLDTSVQELVRNSLAVLKTLRHEVRVDLNLAGNEMRDRWRRLETRLRTAESRAKEARREGAVSLAALVESAKKFRKQLRDNLAGSEPQSQSRASRLRAQSREEDPSHATHEERPMKLEGDETSGTTRFRDRQDAGLQLGGPWREMNARRT